MDFGDIRIIDAHIHQWDPFATPRVFSSTAKMARRLHISPGIAVKLTSKRDREFIGHPAAYLAPYLPADYRDDTGDLPIESIVHIECEWDGPKTEETRWLAALPFGVDTPALAALSVGADPAAPGFAHLLDEHLAASPKVRGIRTMVAHHPDPAVRAFGDPEHLRSAAFLDGFAALAERNLHFEAWVYAQQLPEVTALARRYPEVTVVLNHLATPAGIFGRVGKHTGATPAERQALFETWRDDIAALAALPNAVAKVSGLMMPILGHPIPKLGAATPVPELIDRIGPMLRHAADVFGPERLIWGSNFPVDKPVTSIAGSADAVARVLADHTGDAGILSIVFRENAIRVYRLD